MLKFTLGIKTSNVQYVESFLSIRGYLNEHFKIHTGQKDYECTICGKRFSCKGNLNLHVKIHNGQKDYECTICGKLFIYKGNLKKHVRIHTRK